MAVQFNRRAECGGLLLDSHPGIDRIVRAATGVNSHFE